MHGIKKIFLPAILSLFLLTGTGILYAQPGAINQVSPEWHEAIIYQGDTIEMKTLGQVLLIAHGTAAYRKARAEYNRLRNAVYVTYPYAHRAGLVMNDINRQLEGHSKKSERKAIIHSREKELKKEFSTPLTNLSVYQGKVLMKLINRETGNNCYEIISEYKGSLTARFYQTVAFFFNSSLKQPYNPQKEDLVMEKLVKEVQRLYGYNDQVIRQQQL